MMEEVPTQHEGAWAWGEILERINRSEDNSKELDRGLMWLSFLPQALLRKSKRGGRAGRGLVAQRFNLLSNGDWGGLV